MNHFIMILSKTSCRAICLSRKEVFLVNIIGSFFMVEPSEIKWSEITFSLTPTRTMYVATCLADESWQRGELRPYGNLSISPAAGVLNYGQGAFEGLKAYHTHDNKSITLFRPRDNARRLLESCKRLCMPPVPEDFFMEAIVAVVKSNKDYVPPYRPESSSQGSLYLRPLVCGTGAMLGVKPAPEYTFVVFASPVGPYFKSGFQPIKLKIETKYHRAAPGGTGCVKSISNYVGGMYPAKIAKQEGFSEVLYLDAKEDKYIEEVGAANFFCLHGNTLLTPDLGTTILAGITRRSVMQLALDMGLKVEERRVTLEEALSADEAFASGTAAVISPIGSMTYNEKTRTIGDGNVGKVTSKIYHTLLAIQHGAEPDRHGWMYKVE